MSKTKYEYYKDPNVESFMIDVLEKTDKVNPIFDLNIGYRYPHVEKAVKMDTDATQDFLENLVKVEILDKELHDMEIRCPMCNSPNVSVNYVCPKCISPNIRKTILLEHNICGYIGTVINFGEPLGCPKCGQQIKKGEYRDAGSIYECAECNQQIETPFIDHRCRKCGSKSSFENAIYQPKYAYSSTKLTRMEINRGIVYLRQVKEVFEEQGFTQEMKTSVQGESKVEHVFDAAFSGHGTKYYIDLNYSINPMSEIELLKKYSKINDLRAAPNVEVCLLIIPGLEPEAQALVKSYRMNVITGHNPQTALTTLKAVLIEKATGKKPDIKVEPEPDQQSMEPETEEESDDQNTVRTPRTSRISRVRVRRKRSNATQQ